MKAWYSKGVHFVKFDQYPMTPQIHPLPDSYKDWYLMKKCLKGVAKRQKICYDNIGKLPNKGRKFNTQTFRKMYLFVICMISRHWFQTKLLLYIA